MKNRSFDLETFSKPYYSFIDEFAKTGSETAKLLGKFYTDFSVGEILVEEIVKSIKAEQFTENIKIIDPFCGDGRLIVELLKNIYQIKQCEKLIFEITLWDVDEYAVDIAKSAVADIAKDLKLNIKIQTKVTDAFVSYSEVMNMFDICITNPPWGLLKPLKVFNNRCNSEELNKYKETILMYSKYMDEEFTISRPMSRYGKWGTNLGRCGVELALKLITNNGICGIVSPVTLFTDKVSIGLRKWIFDNYDIHSVFYFPAELNLYKGADVSSVTAVVKKGLTEEITIRTYDSNFNFRESILANDDITRIKSNDYVIPLDLDDTSKSIWEKWEKFITVEEYCEIKGLHFIRELDETRIKEKLCDSSKYAFAKGYMVNKYVFTPDNLFLDESMIKIPKSAKHLKLVWRDVSRSSQKRRVKAAILPKYCIAGNSLGVLYSEDDNINVIKSMLAIMNSYVFEFQVRKQLISNHVPAGVIKKMKIPSIIDTFELITLVDKKLAGELVEDQIEVMVAKMYGLKLEEFTTIVNSFDKDNCDYGYWEHIWNE